MTRNHSLLLSACSRNSLLRSYYLCDLYSILIKVVGIGISKNCPFPFALFVFSDEVMCIEILI